MEHGVLLDNITQHIALSDDARQQLISAFQPRRLRKKQFFLQEGNIQTQAIFVSSGCLRSYSIDRNGFEHILQFAPAGWWIADIRSFTRQEPALLSIDAIEDSQVLLVQRKELDALYLSVPSLDRFFRILAENALANYQHRLIDNLSLPAIERYNNFCSLYPSLNGHISQKQVASYIGVTPEFLSKLLNQSGLRK